MLESAVRIMLGAVAIVVAVVIISAFVQVLQPNAGAGTAAPGDAGPVAAPTAPSTTSAPAPTTAAPTTVPPTTIPPNCGREAPTAGDGDMVVRISFHCGAPGALEPTATYRVVERTNLILTTTTRLLLDGPTDDEMADGYTSPFSAATAGALLEVTFDDGAVVVDFADLGDLAGVDEEPGRSQLLADLNDSLFRHQHVDSIEYRMEGSCGGFWQMLGVDDCDVVTRAEWEAA